MKKILLSLIALFAAFTAKADEGMWLLKLMEQQHLEDSLRKAGLVMSPDELYNENAPSLRDVIGIFGAGCTGELVSSEGLVLTNNHCGFSYVHDISTNEHNYLYQGFFAKSRAEELPCPDLTFTFVIRIDDVTAEVEKAAVKGKGKKATKLDAYTMQSQEFLEPLAEKLLQKSGLANTKGISMRIVPYFGGNQYYAFYEQTYSDVRLVVNPPMQIAQYGFNQDNWVWPRHNADFAMFRIYADKENQPAEYDEANQPLQCKKWLHVSLNGVKENDYTMIMGFPGRTSRYLTKSQVELRCGSTNEPINLAGEAELNFMKQQMDSDPKLALKYADDYMSLGNVTKNFGGMNESVKKTHLLDIKAEEEALFRAFAEQSGNAEYLDIIDRINACCETYKDSIYDRNLFQYTFAAGSFWVRPSQMDALLDKLEKGTATEADRKALLDSYMQSAGSVDMQYDLDKMLLLTPYWTEKHRLDAQPAFAAGKTADEIKEYFRNLYTTSAFRSYKTAEEFVMNCSAQQLREDPLYKHTKKIVNFMERTYADALDHYNHEIVELNRIYVRGLCEMYDWAKSPDANFTLRMTYGHVGGYQPRDAVRYDWKTTLSGMMEKENPNDPDYVIDEPLRKFWLDKNFGRYAREDGELQTCFLTNNDITGGNSGSAVLNAKGELIGLAFDGNIESLSSDLRFNPALQRCICVDIRYVLFVIDMYGGSSYAVKEMTIK